MRIPALVAAVVCLVLLDASRADTPAELAVIVNHANPVKVDRASLTQIFTLTRRSWPNQQPILVLNLPHTSAPRHTFDSAVLGMSPEEVSRFWINSAIRGHGRPPRQVAEPKLVVRLVAALKNGIGYVPADVADASVRVVARIKGGQVVPP